MHIANHSSTDRPHDPVSWTIADCLNATGGELVGEETDRVFSGISIDSRQATAADLFVAIKGDVHDGHGFANDVVKNGVRGLILSRERIPDLPWQDWLKAGAICVAVDDTIQALGDLARFHRLRSSAAVVAITGSNGKTTTRQMTAAVVSQGFKTLSSRKNFNNNIGLPLTLFDLVPDHQWAVVELGMNAPGEIASLAGICQPDIGVITNVGPAHLEGVGSLEGVMKAKGELLGKIKPEGTAILNADDSRVMQLAEQTEQKVLLYGFSNKAAIRAFDVIPTDRGHTFSMTLPDEDVLIDLKIPGRFMIFNALAAAAVGAEIGLSPDRIKTGLENFQPAHGRMHVLETRHGLHIIDDTYNANPGSMEVALNTLQTLRKGRRGIFVTGDMKELGQHAARLHKEVGAMAVRAGIVALYATGEFAEKVAAGAAEAGMETENIITGDKDQILNALISRVRPDDWILVKGSRAMAMEEVVQKLREWADNIETGN